MQQPGWYPDPSGQPGRFRFWDGRAWTTVTTGDPRQPWPVPAPEPRVAKTPVIIAVAAALVLLLGAGGFWAATRGSTPDPAPTTPGPGGFTTSTQPSGPTSPTMGAAASLDCSGGNNIYTRTALASYTSTGVTYQGVPDWRFSFSPTYWTWLDDHSSMGDIRLDAADNEAGITLGGIRFDNGFADQSTAGELTLECLEGSLSLEEPTTAGPATTRETELDGMRTFHTRSEFTAASTSVPLVVDVYVIDAGQGNKWAQLITFHRAGSSAQAQIEQAVSTLRHV
ncbi:MAG: DUF2510 domain-containing protein [Propionibacteriaceae bacterium]|nr:DUF2510 domain-containing protein [Propionibacteriaceae bacterium]